MQERKLETKIQAIDSMLESHYGIPRRKKKFPVLDEFILTILSQNTSDKNSYEAFRRLKEKYNDARDLVSASKENIAEAIKVAGLGPTKAVYILNLLRWLKSNYGGFDCAFLCKMETNQAIAKFTQINGIGIKTISVVLAFACGRDLFPVDTHVFRVTKRLGLIPDIKTPEEAFHFLRKFIPKGKGFPLHMNIIRHGREVCFARSPRCKNCLINSLCEYYHETGKNT